MVITKGFDGGDENTPLIVKDCVFENNTCAVTAVIYYAEGNKATIDNNEFKNNVVFRL